MKTKFNPILIGLFVVSGIVLSILLIVAFSSGGLFTRKVPFVVVFPHSVNGLYVGSRVKFKGVPVGEVTKLGIRLDEEGNPNEIIVHCEFNADLVSSGSKNISFIDPHILRRSIEKGLRARCASESFVTGTLYVDLDIYSNAPPPVYRAKDMPYIEIPVLYESAADFLRSLNQINFQQLAEQTEQILYHINRILSETDMKQISSSITKTLDSIEALVSSEEVKQSIVAFTELMNQTQLLLTNVQQSLPAVSTNLVNTLAQTKLAVERLDITFRQLQYLIEPGAPLMVQLQQALLELTETVRGLRILVEQFQENPAMIITGKPIKKP